MYIFLVYGKHISTVSLLIIILILIQLILYFEKLDFAITYLTYLTLSL